MFSSFFQKPLGAVTVLGTAVGAPYALFETDAGATARSTVQSWMTSTPNAEGAGAIPSGGAVPTGAAPIPHGMLISQASTPATSGSTGSPSSWFNTTAPQNTAPMGNMPISSAPMNPTTVNGSSFGSPAIGTVTPMPSNMSVGPAVSYQAPMQGWSQTPSMVAAPVYDVREVIRFDMTPMGLLQRFQQVTTIPGNPHYDIQRVALSTGTQPTDLAGTLTYFFDANKVVQRIQFTGTTGDPSMIASMMVQYYRLQPEPSLGGQLFTTRWNGRVTSLMHATPAAVLQYSPNAHANYSVFMELNQPSPYYGLSEEAARFLPPQAQR